MLSGGRGQRHSDARRSRGVSRAAAWVLALAASALPLGQSVFGPTVVHAAAPNVTRAPYLTDLAASSVLVNLGTDTSTPAPQVTYGVSPGCTGGSGSPVTATGGASYSGGGASPEFRWKAKITGLAADTDYCYKVSQGGTDLIAEVNTTAYPALPAGGFSTKFHTIPPASVSSFKFAVIGDFGGGTPDEAKNLTQMGALNPRFVLTVGDNVYNSGSESEYGDLAPAPAGKGNLFAAQFWPQLGGGVPAFFAQGNHGFSNSAPLFADIPQDSTIAACTGCTYGVVNYPATNAPPLQDAGGNFGTDYYAFSYGNTRFYVLHSAWTDRDTAATCPPLPAGQSDPSGGPYCADYVNHWQTTSPEYTWLKADMESHPSQLKFAFFHYPLWADGGAQSSDPYTNSRGPAGTASLENLLASHGVDIAFTGHDHAYQRNNPMVAGSPMVSYVTGGGGDTLLAGTSCNSPGCAFAAQKWSFLSVQVSGTGVTVTPTDETGAAFDQQTYSFPSPLGSIKGTVTDSSTHAAVAGASITCTCGGSATSAADGSYTIASVTPGSYSVTASAANYTTQTATGVDVTANTATTRDFALVLAAGSISGTVTDASTHAAISGAAISCSCGASATSAANGGYTLPSVLPGTYSVTAAATAHVTQTAASVAVTAGNNTVRDFALVPTGSITGTVTDSVSAQPIAGAQVSDGVDPAVVSNASGVYTIPNVTPATLNVTASAAGHVSQTVSVTVSAGAPSSQNFALAPTPPGSVGGTVRDSSSGHNPISGATVTCACGVSATSDGNGAYTLPTVPAGSQTVTATATGFSQQTATVVVTSNATTTQDFTLTVTPGSIVGTITDATTNGPISGASVSDGVDPAVLTNSSGAYSIVNVAPGTYTVSASAAGYTTQSATSVAVASGQPTTQNLALPVAPGSITGVITDAATHAGIGGASVTCSCGNVSSGANGAYTYPSLAPATYSLTVSAPGHISQTALVTVHAATQSTQNFALLTPGPQLVQSAASSTTTVSFPAATGAGDLLVLNAGLHTGSSQQITAVSDGRNTWTMVGSYFVSGQYSNGAMWYAANAQPVTSITVTTGASPLVLQAMEFSGAATSSPLDGSLGTSATSTAAGSGSITPTTANDLLVGFVAGHNNAQAISVTAPGYTTLAQQTSGTTTGASLISGYKVLGTPSSQSFTGSFASTMYWAAGIAAFKSGAPPPPPTTGSISGTVTDASTNSPIAGATVSDGVDPGVSSNGSGVYTISNVTPGSYTVTASAAGYTTQTASAVAVTAGQQTTRNFSMPTIPPGSITGTVSDSVTGQPITGASVSDGVHPTVSTNGSGVYTIANVAPATYSVTASAAGHVSQTVSVAVSSGAASTQSFVLSAPPPGNITGTVTATGGAAIAGASVSDGIDLAVTTNGSGVYTITGVAPGTYTLTVTATGYTTQTASGVTVTSGQATTRNVTMPVAPGGISGTVMAAGGGPIPGATVSDGVDPAVTSNASGVYTISGVAPGTYTVSAAAAGYATGSTGAMVTAGQTTQNVNFSLAAAPPPAGPKFVQSAGSTSSAVSFPAPTTAGDLLVLSAGLYTGVTQQITAVSDGRNTWTRVGAFATSGHNSDGELWYAANAQPVTSITVSTGATGVVLEVMEFSGVATVSPLDVSAGASNTGTAAASGSVSATGATDLAVGFIAGHGSAQAITVTSSGYTTQAQQSSGGSIASLITGYRVLSSAGAQAFAGSFASAMYWAAGVVCFKSAS